MFEPTGSARAAGTEGAVGVLLEVGSSNPKLELEHNDSGVRSWKSSSMGMYGANISRSKPTGCKIIISSTVMYHKVIV